MIEMVQYKARNKEDGQIYWLRKVHSSVPDIYFVFKQPQFSDRAYCGKGYCQNYDILEAIPMENMKHEEPENVSRETIPEKKMSLRERLNLPPVIVQKEEKKEEPKPEPKKELPELKAKPKPKGKQKMAQMKLF